MWNLLGGAIGALGSIYGANVASDTQEQINQQNIAFQTQQNAQNLAQQLNFAQNGAGWNLSSLVNTAGKVGINPLAALGVGGSSFSNMVAPQATAPSGSGSPGALYSQAGQNLGRAIGAIQSPQDQQYDQATKALTLQKGALENDLLRSQITKLNAAGNPPGVPNFADAGPPPPGAPGVKPGVEPDAQWVRTVDGGLALQPPKEISQMGFFHPAAIAWSIRNGLLPAFGENSAPGQSAIDYNPFTMSYPKGGTYMGNLYRKYFGDE